MSAFGDWADSINPLRSWRDESEKAQDELVQATQEGMPPTKVRFLQQQLSAAILAEDADACVDVYNEVAAWRAEVARTRRDSPREPKPQFADVVEVVREAGASASSAVRDAADTAGKATKDKAKDVATGAGEVAGAALSSAGKAAGAGAGSLVASAWDAVPLSVKIGAGVVGLGLALASAAWAIQQVRMVRTGV